MLEILRRIGSFFVRITAFVTKEFSTALSQPKLIGVLVLGPFLILLIFGVSYREIARILRAIIVIPPESELEPTIRSFAERSQVIIEVVDITSDGVGALNALNTKAVDIVVVFPEDAIEKLESNERATLTFYHQAIDPYEAIYVEIVARQITEETNRQLLYAAIEEGRATADAQLTENVQLNPAIIVEPFQHETRPLNVTNIPPVAYYFPVALVLLLQHIAISLAGLSIVSERLTGTAELMRAAPVNPIEVLIGKYLGFLMLIGVISAALTLLAVSILKVPVSGGLGVYALVLFLVVSVSLGMGFLISGLVKTDSQAIQITMVLLLATIFFSGLFIPLYKLVGPGLMISWSMPATYGVIMLQDTMLRGIPPASWLFQVLGAAGLVLFLLNWLRLRRLMVQA